MQVYDASVSGYASLTCAGRSEKALGGYLDQMEVPRHSEGDIEGKGDG